MRRQRAHVRTEQDGVTGRWHWIVVLDGLTSSLEVARSIVGFGEDHEAQQAGEATLAKFAGVEVR